MGGEGADLTFWIIVIVGLGVFMFLPQWMARRRQKQREADLRVGDRVVTIGGFIGQLTYLDLESNTARIKLAEGVELSILPGAISGKRADVEGDGKGGRS
jgi:preprotein translocase subunit YajC